MFLPMRQSRARKDPLVGLKENVIIGKLVPAGTGMARYNDIKVAPAYSGEEDVLSDNISENSIG